MSKGGKMFDAIMITIIIIASLNYADYIKVDTKLMMVLLAIALYVTAKQNQKSSQKTQKVEPLDGSTVAFDKEAFVNLNNIVNELVKKDSVTIPGNLIVLGKTTFEADMNVKGITTIEKDLNVHTSVNVGTDDANAVRIRQNRIGTKACADMYFNPNGWLHHFTYGGDGYRPNCGYAASYLYAGNHTHIVGSLRVDKGTELHGTLNAHGQVTCNNTSISGLTVGGNLTIGGVTTQKGDLNCSAGIRSAWIYTGIVDTDQLKGHAWGAAGHISCPQNLVLRKDNNNEIVMWDGNIRLKATGVIKMVPHDNRNPERNAFYEFHGTFSNNKDEHGHIVHQLTDGHFRGIRWAGFSKKSGGFTSS